MGFLSIYVFFHYVSFFKIGLSDDPTPTPVPSESNSTKAYDKSASHLVKSYRVYKKPATTDKSKRDSDDDVPNSPPATFIAGAAGSSRQRTPPNTTLPFFEDANSLRIQSTDHETYPFYDDGDRALQSHQPSLHYPVQPESLTPHSSLNPEPQLRHRLLLPREGSQLGQSRSHSYPSVEQRLFGGGTPPPGSGVFDSLRLRFPNHACSIQ